MFLSLGKEKNIKEKLKEKQFAIKKEINLIFFDKSKIKVFNKKLIDEKSFNKCWTT